MYTIPGDALKDVFMLDWLEIAAIVVAKGWPTGDSSEAGAAVIRQNTDRFKTGDRPLLYRQNF